MKNSKLEILKSIENFRNEKIRLDVITGGATGTATGDTCSNNQPDDCDVEPVPIIKLPK